MKFLWALILSCTMYSLGFAQTIPTVNVNLNYENQPLSTILKDISDTHGISFSYGNLSLKKKTSFAYEGRLDEGLKTFFKNENILLKEIGGQLVLKADKPVGQPIKGEILDQDSKMPLIGASIRVVGSDPLVGTVTDYNGEFRLEKLKVGRYDLLVEYLGYEPRKIDQVLVTTGKDTYLGIELRESALAMDEIVVVAKDDVVQAQNEMATTSARSFSVEEASRFAASVSDPARMALSFAGVSSGGDDLENEIIIRGNSSKGLLWKLEGVEIPNPNHFSDLGSGGGSISMLSAATLSNSDFYTGAFPAEFGNAISGVFDLQMRKGNNEKREHSFQIGTLGIEASTEGYFSKKSKASYLINYRYSTIALIDRLLPTVQGGVTTFQDVSFKVNIPTKKAGTFSLFGLSGVNFVDEDMDGDSSNYTNIGQLEDYLQKQGMGVIGLTHRYILDDNSYLRSSVGTSFYNYYDETIQLQPDLNFAEKLIDESDFVQYETTLSTMYHRKINKRHNLRAGISLRHQSFDHDYKSLNNSETLISFLENAGSTQLIDAYAQWKYRLGAKWELNAGVNASMFTLNNTYSIDPRMGIKYQLKRNQSLALSTGLYSKPEHLSTYLIERRDLNGMITSPNKDLPMLKAFHLVGAYDCNITKKLRFKAEAYYQYLYDIPVGNNSGNEFSVLNASNIFELIFLNNQDGAYLVPEGTGTNYGIDLTLEKFFSNGSYFLVTGSLFDAKFTNVDGTEYHSRYASNYVTNLLGGKEWAVGKTKKNAFGVNVKFNFAGGLRTTPINLELSKNLGETVFDDTRILEVRNPNYYRIDAGVFYRINKKKATHTIKLDVQNVTNRFNTAFFYYDPGLGDINSAKQNGLIPFFNYKIEF